MLVLVLVPATSTTPYYVASPDAAGARAGRYIVRDDYMLLSFLLFFVVGVGVIVVVVAVAVVVAAVDSRGPVVLTMCS